MLRRRRVFGGGERVTGKGEYVERGRRNERREGERERDAGPRAATDAAAAA